ncbi:MAG: hypothetical protein EAZ25_00475 [Oscillatoriales cyanobacterium]|nr:MAG: hypothetical protein EAZ25_00475 [Oscillatoriales cyanobacterium]
MSGIVAVASHTKETAVNWAGGIDRCSVIFDRKVAWVPQRYVCTLIGVRLSFPSCQVDRCGIWQRI